MTTCLGQPYGKVSTYLSNHVSNNGAWHKLHTIGICEVQVGPDHVEVECWGTCVGISYTLWVCVIIY